ncbi:hypothetical protein [Streptomyces europaeiscabiei]|uniref:hypothetical protein n=1 Tax=Streptomyces europaeiscabiei TaxID=146819 RepID=UPI000E69729D|nr:hypothetical protein [Streptomyces europaeiscabiei]MDX3838679.1 hypothetical protein [Streptomyces europaeiscabiei]
MRPGRQQELAEDGALANSGILKVTGDPVLGQRRPRGMRTGYPHAIAELAAARFEGRTAELAAMAAVLHRT